MLDEEVMLEQGLARGRLFNIHSFRRHLPTSCDVILGKGGAVIQKANTIFLPQGIYVLAGRTEPGWPFCLQGCLWG